MNYEKRFLEIRDFLKKYSYLHELEMLQRNESPLNQPYRSWADELCTLSQAELIELENSYSTESIKNTDLKNFLSSIKNLIQLPQRKVDPVTIPKNLKRKLSLKKEHEITMIKSLLKAEDIDLFVDIGSGAGHLSSCLLDENQRSICIDMNRSFQEGGVEKLKRWSPKTLEQIQFVQLEVKNSQDLKQFNLTKNSMVLGLHACGALSSSLVKLKAHRLLNFGCCYHKLKSEYNLSSISKESPIIFTNQALTSAAKGYALLEKEDYDQKYKVKRYRYTLHFFLKEILQKDFASVGNGNKNDYNLPFADYCHKFSKDTLPFSKAELEDYFIKKKSFIESVIISGVLRALLGRVIEIYIILDRILYLKENGQEPRLFELFEREISPRNIAIFV
jgi:hypothetical protein